MPDPSSPDTSEVLRITVDEYRFQVRLNADRINYWFTVTAAMLVAGAALANVDGARWAATAVLGLTTVAALLFAAAVGAQHGYYHAARDRMREAATEAGVPGLLETTPGMRAENGRRVKIVHVVQGVFVLLALAAAVGAVGVALA